MTRWVYALLVPVWVAALFSEVDWRLLVAPRDLPKASETQPGKGSAPGLLGRFGAHADGAFSAAACTLVVLGFVLVGLSPQIALIARDASQGEVGYLGDAQTYWWNPANAWQSNITNADGQFHYERPIALYYSLPFVHPDYVAIWFTPFLLIGLWAMRRQPFPLVLLLGWVGVNWFFLAGVAWENWRFPIVFFPPLAIFTGGGLATLLERFRTRRGLILSAWIGAGLAIALAWGVRDASDFIAHQMQDRAIVQWASAQLPGDATVLCFGMTATMVHFTPFQVIEIADETPDSVTKIARDGRAVYLLIDQDNIESQWTGLAPQLNVRALRNQFALRLLGTRDDYVLYSIGRAR
jgi:hypothetical protein